MCYYIGKTAVTFGVFDLLHFGHFELFRRIRELVGPNGKLIVACQVDEYVSKYKSVCLTYDWKMRAKMIGALRYVDTVVPYTDVDVTIKTLEFDVACFGIDQCHEGFQRAMDWCRLCGRMVHVLPRTEGISSSQLRSGTIK